MADAEIIEGKNLVRFFEELRKKKTVIKMNLLSKNYERLTIIVGILNNMEPFHFIIDYPSGFKRIIDRTSEWQMRFEFKGNDKLTYRFRTSGGYISGKEICVPFPPSVERLQRRFSFRLDDLFGARMRIPKDTEQYELTVINVSEKGALIGGDITTSRHPLFQPGDYIQRITIFFSEEDGQILIPIRKALVKRLEKDPLTLHHRYAIQFVDLERSERKELKEQLYKVQRDFLKKRQRIED